MAELPSTNEDNFYQNNLMHQIFQKMMKSKTPDVQFIFEGKDDNETVKISAHKDVLAAMSPVFDSMFNGELKEKGDVKIVDASAAAFEEFLQFFYEDQVKLTMEHIGDVLNLAHKYDVTDCFQMAIAFLKNHLNSENLIWGLHLAFKYESEDLKVFCKRKIGKNPKALDVFKADGGDMPKKMLFSSTALQSALFEALSIANEVITKQSEDIERLRSKCVLQFVVSKRTAYIDKQITPSETIKLWPKDYNKSLWLSEIHFAKVFRQGMNKMEPFHLEGTIMIEDRNGSIFEKQFGMKSNEDYIKLPEPIHFNPVGNFPCYTITIKPSVCGYPSAIEDKNVNVAFKDKLAMWEDLKYSLIDRLYFEELPKN